MSHPQLAQIRDEFQAISHRAIAVVERVGNDRVAIAPAQQAWSIAECLTHLIITAEAYLPIWQQAYVEARTKGRAASGNAAFKMDLLGKFFVWFLEPPPKIRFRAPQEFRPLHIGSPAEVLSSFLASQERVLAAIAEADGLLLDQIMIRSPFDRRVRYSVWSSFRANAAHHRRHLWQAERAAEALEHSTHNRQPEVQVRE